MSQDPFSSLRVVFHRSSAVLSMSGYRHLGLAMEVALCRVTLRDAQCMYVYIYIYICMCECVLPSIHIYICCCLSIHAFLYIHIRMYVYTFMCIRCMLHNLYICM